jgi:hypothetical protein
MCALKQKVKLESKLPVKSAQTHTRQEDPRTSNSFLYFLPTTFFLISASSPQISTAGCTFSAYSFGGSFRKTVLLCHLKYGLTPSTSANAADWLNGTDVMHSYANCAGTVGTAALCVATAALTAAHGLPVLLRGCNGDERANDARDRPARVLKRRGILIVTVAQLLRCRDRYRLSAQVGKHVRCFHLILAALFYLPQIGRNMLVQSC